MTKIDQNRCDCAKTTCGCATAAKPCTCGERCACERACACAGGCTCAEVKR